MLLFRSSLLVSVATLCPAAMTDGIFERYGSGKAQVSLTGNSSTAPATLNPRFAVATAAITAGLTTFYARPKHRIKETLRRACISAGGSAAALSLLALADSQETDCSTHESGAHMSPAPSFLRAIAAATYLCAQNAWNPWATFKDVRSVGLTASLKKLTGLLSTQGLSEATRVAFTTFFPLWLSISQQQTSPETKTAEAITTETVLEAVTEKAHAPDEQAAHNNTREPVTPTRTKAFLPVTPPHGGAGASDSPVHDPLWNPIAPARAPEQRRESVYDPTTVAGKTPKRSRVAHDLTQKMYETPGRPEGEENTPLRTPALSETADPFPRSDSKASLSDLMNFTPPGSPANATPSAPLLDRTNVSNSSESKASLMLAALGYHELMLHAGSKNIARAAAAVSIEMRDVPGAPQPPVTKQDIQAIRNRVEEIDSTPEAPSAPRPPKHPQGAQKAHARGQQPTQAPRGRPRWK